MNELELQIDLRPQRKPKVKSRATEKVPPVLETLVLAHQIEQALAEGRAKSYGEVARQLLISQPRLTQIMMMLKLVPKIQEQILLSNSAEIKVISEHRLRNILRETNNDQQSIRFDQLLASRAP